MHSRRRFLKYSALLTAGASTSSLLPFPRLGADRPNFIVIFCDDLGYGDLGSFGHPTIKTPHLDRMAAEGQKWTSFYSAASVCTPSRAALMTGRLPVRNGMMSGARRVLFPDSPGGLQDKEITIAEALKAAGYRTGMVGKWHLGHLPEYLPTRHGFDSYYGIPYSNDMDATQKDVAYFDSFGEPKVPYWNVPLFRDEEIIERPANQELITTRYTEESLRFISRISDDPFFLYLPHSLPHVPLFTSPNFAGTSQRGLYGDVIEEIDHGVGQIVKRLYDIGKAENTMIVFTSDNGPWTVFGEHGGSAGLLREGKGMTWEGGMREPTIFWWPGKIKPAVVHDMGSTMDLFATMCALAGAEVPTDRVMDTHDLSPTLFDGKENSRDTVFYYREAKLFAVRHGAWKAHYITKGAYTENVVETVHERPLLFNVETDPEESHDVSGDHPDILAAIDRIVAEHQERLVMDEDQLAGRSESAIR